MEGFRTVFPIYKRHPTRKTFLYAENEYVQMLCDAGLIGCVLLAATVAAYFCCLRGAPADPSRRGMVVLAWCVISVAGVHSFFDFPLRVPLNLMTVAVLLGCALPRAFIAGSGPKEMLVRAGAFAWIAAAAVFCGVAWVRGAYTDTQGWIEKASPEQLAGAICRAPTHWIAWYELGRRVFRLARSSSGKVDLQSAGEALRLRRFAVECIKTAARCNPSNYQVWWQLGRAEVALGRLDRAAEAFQRAVRLRPYLAEEARSILERAEWPWRTADGKP